MQKGNWQPEAPKRMMPVGAAVIQTMNGPDPALPRRVLSIGKEPGGPALGFCAGGAALGDVPTLLCFSTCC